jgi:hypothetical protein
VNEETQNFKMQKKKINDALVTQGFKTIMVVEVVGC